MWPRRHELRRNQGASAAPVALDSPAASRPEAAATSDGLAAPEAHEGIAHAFRIGKAAKLRK